MHSKQNSLSLAVRLALSLGLASGASAIRAQSTTPDDRDAPPKETKTLDAIEVTGSLLRRVDTETANPVVTLDRETLENNGNPTLGNVLQALPSFSGFATNPTLQTTGAYLGAYSAGFGTVNPTTGTSGYRTGTFVGRITF